MKTSAKGNHPLPILLEDGGDYIGDASLHCELSLESEPEQSKETIYRFGIKVDLNCPPLEKAISEGNAKIYICEEQFTIRRFYPYFDGMVIEVDASNLALPKPLTFTPLIVAEKAFSLLYDRCYMDPFYGLFSQQKYAVQKRQILGYGNVCNVKTFNVKALSQILNWSKLDTADEERPFSISLDSDKIEVQLNPSLFETILELNERAEENGGVTNSVLAYPIFYQTILAMCLDHERYQGYRWYQAIVAKINEVRTQKGYDEFDPSDFAQKVNPGFELSSEIWILCNEVLSNKTGLLMERAMVGFDSLKETV